MRILAIRGKNLASLEGEFEVDFTAEPLKSAGIFAITGSTGSGKSTLLDAICLALFTDTPRINRAADNADIADVKELTIKQKDSRNILRRGTAEGYAEVDFVALSGETHRARWSVRRSRDKANGSLQPVSYQVFNLTANRELQGGKTELLQRVKELIGLTFDQFTRAVLLAQGDFATFLKAAAKEKAELLEKLTGTDIYSRISAKIYENSKQAEAELALITERIKDVELLSKEQQDELTKEKEQLAGELTQLDAELKRVSAKLQWWQTNEQLIRSITTAQGAVETCKEAIEGAKERFEALTRIERVQQIRDPFKQLENVRKQLANNEASLKEQQILNSANSEELAKAKESLATIDTTLQQLTTAWKEMEPQLQEARKLDVQMEAMAKSLTEMEQECTQMSKQKETCAQSIVEAEKKSEAMQHAQTALTAWFETNKLYEAIIPRVELITSYITDAQNAAKQRLLNKQRLAQLKELLENEEQQLTTQQTEAKRLNDMLPAEIALLRERLQESEPCPVCGSTHHSISSLTVETLEERELNRAKVLVAQEIERLSASILNRNGEVIRLQSLITGYEEQQETTFAKLTESLRSLPHWQEKYEQETLSNELTNVTAQWNGNLAKQTKHAEQLATSKQEHKAAAVRLLELTESLGAKKEKLQVATEAFAELRSRRNELLRGRKAEEIEKRYLNKQQTTNSQLIQATEWQNRLIAKGENIGGMISQLTANREQLQVNSDLLEKTVSEWLRAREDQLTIEELALLLSKESAWLTAEREALDKLRQNELSAQTTLAERRRVAEEHRHAAVQPTEAETPDWLTNTFNEKTAVADNKQKRITEIGVLFSNHEKGQEKIKQFEKELAERGSTAENWQKLNELFGSADGAKFKVLAQGYTLDVLLGYANKHLKDISQRYLLARVSPHSLALQVIDLDMMSEVRSVHSLSGGESFLISLALALGLSSLSSNRMRIESLFIDEGFGSLDADTLRVAMDALERLQTQGRKIGVISHVAEMTERIPTQIRVIKTTHGRSHIEVAGVSMQ